MAHRPDPQYDLEDCKASMNAAIHEIVTLEQQIRLNPTANRATVAAYAARAIRASEKAQTSLSRVWDAMESEYQEKGHDHQSSPTTIPMAAVVRSPRHSPGGHGRFARQLILRGLAGV